MFALLQKKTAKLAARPRLCSSSGPGLIGIVLVDKQMRGKGIGRMLMTDIINRLDHIESIKLDATPAGLPLYRKLGFNEEYSLYRMTNTSFSINPECNLDNCEKINKTNISNILQSDRVIFGSDRSVLLSYLLEKNQRVIYISRNGKTEATSRQTGMKYFVSGSCMRSNGRRSKEIVARSFCHSGGPMALDITKTRMILSDGLKAMDFSSESFTRIVP
jgi:hypothetical protein